MAARFKMSNKGVGQLLRSPMIQAEMLRRAERIKTVAVSISPVGGRGDPHPGAYKSSWHAEVQQRPVGRSRKRRAVGVVTNTSPYARFVEYGTERYQGRHVLLRAALAGGR